MSVPPSATSGSSTVKRRVPKATFVTPNGSTTTTTVKSNSLAGSPVGATSSASNSSPSTMFFHHVTKVRRVIAGAASLVHTHARWRRVLNTVRFAVRLRRAGKRGVKLTALEREHLYRVYWEHSQSSGGLFDAESIARMLQQFNQPQPPTTVEQLLEHVHFRLPPASDTGGGDGGGGPGTRRSQQPISFHQVLQMLLHIKRSHMDLTSVSDEEELFLQLAHASPPHRSASGGGGDEFGSPLTGTLGERRHSETMRPSSTSTRGGSGVGGSSRVDASAVSSILAHFDLRVAPPELFASSDTPSSPTASVGNAKSKGTDTPPPPVAASSMLKFEDFQDFLQQRGVKAANGANVIHNGSRRSSTASNNLTSPTGRSPVGDGEGYDFHNELRDLGANATNGLHHNHTTAVVDSPRAAAGNSLGGLRYSPLGRSASPPGHMHSSASSPHHLQASMAEGGAVGFDGNTNGGSSAMVTARGSGAGGSRVDDFEVAADYHRMLYDGHSEQLVDLKKHVRRVERRHQAQVRTANAKMQVFESEVERVKAAGSWALQRHQQPQPLAAGGGEGGRRSMSSSLKQHDSAQRRPTSSSNAGRGSGAASGKSTIHIVRVRPNSAMLPSSHAASRGASKATTASPNTLTASPTRRDDTNHHLYGRSTSPVHRAQAHLTHPAAGMPPHQVPTDGGARKQRPQTAQPIVHGKQLFAQGVRAVSPSTAAAKASEGGSTIRETSYHSHVPSIWVGGEPKQQQQSQEQPNAQSEGRNRPPMAIHGSSPPHRAGSPQQHLQRPPSSAAMSRPMSAPLHNNTTIASSQRPSTYYRPGSASSIRRKLDLYIHPTPLADLAEVAPFRLSEKQQEAMGAWYAHEYTRLLTQPYLPVVDALHHPASGGGGGPHIPAGHNNNNNNSAGAHSSISNPWAFDAATCSIAASVRTTLGYSQADCVNYDRSTDYHRVSVLEDYKDEHYHNREDHHAHPMSHHSHHSLQHRPQAASPSMGSRPTSAPPLSVTNASAAATSPSRAFAERSWLRGSSFDTAKKIRPPPAGFLT